MTLELVDIETPTIVPRDGFDRPMVVPPEGGRPVPFTRTTTFIDCIEDKSAIVDWSKRMVLAGTLLLDAETVAKIHTLDLTEKDDKHEADLFAEEAMRLAGAHEKREKGTELHGLSELVDGGQPLPATVSETDMLDIAEYAIATTGMTFEHIEEFVVEPTLKVGGTPDRVCTLDDSVLSTLAWRPPGINRYIFDLKTGTVEYGGLKMAAQLGIYSRAQFYDFMCLPAPPYVKSGVKKKDDPELFAARKAWDAWRTTEFTAEQAAEAYRPLPEVNQEWGIILHLPAGESRATLYWVDLTVGWRAAELAISIREMRSLSGRSLKRFEGAVSSD